MIADNSQRQAEANLQLAADTIERTGWTVARLIAASVERGKPGRPAGNAPDKCISGKVSIRAGAELLRKGQDTIRGYLAAWDRAAADGLCKPAAELVPEEGLTANLPEAAWSEYYITTNFPGVDRDTHGEDKTPAPTPQLDPSPLPVSTQVRDAIKSDPQAQQAARDALDEVYTEQAQTNRRNNPPREETQRDGDQYDLAALVKARKIKRDIGELVGMVNNLGSGWDEALTGEVDWCINALQAIRSSLSGQSMDDALAALLNGEG